MKMFVEPSSIYLHRQFVDFRKSINGPSVIIEAKLQLRAMSGALLTFCNKARDKLWKTPSIANAYKAALVIFPKLYLLIGVLGTFPPLKT